MKTYEELLAPRPPVPPRMSYEWRFHHTRPAEPEHVGVAPLVAVGLFALVLAGGIASGLLWLINFVTEHLAAVLR